MEPKTRRRSTSKDDGICDWNCRFRDEKGNCLLAKVEEVLVKLRTAIDGKRELEEES